MPISIEAYGEDHIPAVRAFNARLASHGIPYRFPESPVPNWLPCRESVPLYKEYFVALEDDTVRGASILKPQAFYLNGQGITIADYQFPISEGIVDRKYGMLGLMLLKHALKQSSLLYGLGMGSYDEPIARLFKVTGWKMVSCPFFFQVNRPFAFLRGMIVLRQRKSRQLLMDAMAFTGIGWAGLKLLHAVKDRRGRPSSDVTAEEVDEFGDWCDEIWQSACGEYALIAVRDRTILNTLYPPGHGRFIRLRVSRVGRTVGWAVLLDTRMCGNKYFGDLRVGTVVDCLAVPGEEGQVVACATRLMRRRGVDLVISNQLHGDWCNSFFASGYLSATSNFIFAACPALVDRLEPFEANARRIHMTRGDGDGPYNL